MAVYWLTDKHYCCFDSEGLNFVILTPFIMCIFIELIWILLVGAMNEIFNLIFFDFFDCAGTEAAVRRSQEDISGTVSVILCTSLV